MNVLDDLNKIESRRKLFWQLTDKFLNEHKILLISSDYLSTENQQGNDKHFWFWNSKDFKYKFEWNTIAQRIEKNPIFR